MVVGSPSKSPVAKSADGSLRILLRTFTITIVSTDDDYNREGKGKEDSDSIAEDIENTLDNAGNLNTLLGYNVSPDIDYDTSEATPDIQEDKDVYVRTIRVTVKGGLVVR